MGTPLTYMSGFGNEHASEAIPGVLPVGRNSPQRAPMGLYAEQMNGTAFTQPRSANRRSWVYRIRPSANHSSFRRIDNGSIRTAPFNEHPADPNRLRWDPLPMPSTPTDFVSGIYTMGGNGDANSQVGIGIHLYAANTSMEKRYFVNADGELLIVPQEGALLFHTEFGGLEVAPGEICVIPRGVRFRVELINETARGYIAENYGAALILPERGPIGANGLANERDFLAPTAAYEDIEDTVELVEKFAGNLWATELDHSPLDVVGWFGDLYPYKYDLACFNTIGTISFDHPDPSIFTVLTSPTNTPGLANIDFVIFPPRWLVGEDTFRPPWYHRNVMSEYMGLITGVYDAKAEGFLPGGSSLHNMWSAHGPDKETFDKASNAQLEPEYVGQTMAFMFETFMPIALTTQAANGPHLQTGYDDVWAGLERNFTKP